MNAMIRFKMKNQIDAVLHEIENTENAKILYACESGSRAWGFASADSDYDVRFIYCRPTLWYLAVNLEDKRDVIERPIDDVLDVSGWDLRKALKLFRKSNPPLLEWLGSPIIYREVTALADRLRELAKTDYSPIACGYHYLRMAQNNCREFLKADLVRRKKYFYVLRPLLAIRWLESDLGVVPTEFSKLVDATVDDDLVRNAIENLLLEKASSSELGKGPQIPVLSKFVYAELARLEDTPFNLSPSKPSIEPLDKIFQDILRDVDDLSLSNNLSDRT